MSSIAHQDQGSGVDLGVVPSRVRPLLELLQPGDSGWTKRQRDGALNLARGMDWQGVLKTRISLGKGDYRLQVDGRGVYLLIDGDVKAVHTEVDPDRLFESLAKSTIPPKIEAEVRSAFRSRNSGRGTTRMSWTRFGSIVTPSIRFEDRALSMTADG
jgi:hypothetical protein